MTAVIKKKSNTVAERVAWFERSSDIHGSHLRTDLDSYLTLIRRKIQEKCATTIELINHIRRYRIGESGAVTPNEFRFTLIKFGVILPQTLVDRVFNVFDSDRSGTMDFDEFAMWIMNSEFRPAVKTAPANMESPQDILRRKLKVVVDANRRTFLNMPKELSYLQYIADVSRMQYAWSENEGRAIFQTLDPKDSGFIQSQALLNWADNGVIQTEAEKQKPPEIVARSLGELISKVVGRNSKQLETAFSHIKHGEGIKITFDEFRRCLLNAGVGKNIHDCQQVFNALGGNISGFADVDLFFNTLSPIMVDPSTEVSAKPAPTANALASRADRLLREKMRKCFKVVSSDIENSDQSNCGYIDADSLFKILVKRCMPLTFQDFRFVIQQIKKEPGGTRIDYKHFLHGYNPQLAPHQLDGPLTIKKYNKSGGDSVVELKQSSNAFFKSAGTDAQIEADYNRQVSSAKEVYNSRNNSAALTKSNNNNNNIGSMKTKDGLLSKSTSYDGGGFTSKFHGGSTTELKRIWQTVLRECHRSDPERVGQVSRMVFIAALEKGDTDKTLTPEAMNKLADEFTLSSGLVNYLHLFRTYLNDLTYTSSLSKSQSMSLFNAAGKNTVEEGRSSPIKPENLRPLHPWDYDYKRERHNEHPYWYQANTMPKDLSININAPSKNIAIPPPNEKGANDLTSTERDLVMSQYKQPVLDLCAKCYPLLAPIWRPLRNHFKREQVPSQRGSVLTSNFLSILEENGIILPKAQLATLIRAFRGLGMQDVVKYDEFLRVCMLMKDANAVPATD